MSNKINRRKFITNTALAGAGLTLTSATQVSEIKEKRKSPIKSSLRVGIMGSGLRGQGHIGLLIERADCQVTAVAEPQTSMVERTKEVFKKRGKSLPTFYSDGDYDYLNMLEKEDLDAVVIASPWMWHSQMATAAMEKGLYTGMEVCGAFSLDECWELVRTSERTGSHLYFLENVCFRRDVMAVLNMVRQGLFGELIHLEGGYQHDLRGVKLNNGKEPYGSGVEFGEKGFSEAQWRTKHSLLRNGELYPTHGIGPVAEYIDINRKNRFIQLTSMASKARGLHNYIVNHPDGGPDHPNAKLDFKLGDKITTMIQTANGESIVLHHDTNLPRPYSLGFRVQGEKGLWMAVNKSIHIEGISRPHRWEDAEPMLEKYDHPLWKRHAQKATGAGHGGMDWFLTHSFVEHAKLNNAPPFDAYDAATWLAITPLSEESIAKGGAPVSFPDFTRGRWTNRNNTFALGDDY